MVNQSSSSSAIGEMQCCTSVEATCLPLERGSSLSSALYWLCSLRRDRTRLRFLKTVIRGC
ncbi:Genome sequencing data, contig C305 (fragment) [Microcystis aeruginosa PCC 9432]|uniref:Genome sequencing data, contig C305 n=2 Tax=Microcystis aeruginosa TaxID=1126 RepID=A0A822L468_MICAE